ncbi:hypothetical protein PIB30_017342 [Stylosanthes scabra]|uniref:Uncharacterized protein n=1 Tax=Stylosanthes scabra TaxID=79078 RepID=A0ABU6T9K5_9FABA|nr:hypothetical protein [Stylosanthes scabra]
MSQFPLLSIHYDGEIIRAEDDFVIFSSANPIFAYLPNNVRCLSSLRNLILDRFSLRIDEEVDLAICWHVHHPDIHLLAILVAIAYRSSSSDANDTQSSDPARCLIRGMIFYLNVTPKGSMNVSNSALNLSQVGSMEEEVESRQRAAIAEHPIVESFFVDHVFSDEEIDREVLSETKVVAEMNYFTSSSIALKQLAIFERYDCPTHFSSLNLDAMNEQVSHRQRRLTMIQQLSSKLVKSFKIRKLF